MRRNGILCFVLFLTLGGMAWAQDDGTRNILFHVEGLDSATAAPLQSALGRVSGVASVVVSARKKVVQLALAKGAQLRWSGVVGVAKSMGLKIGKVQALVSKGLELTVEGLSGDQGRRLAKKLKGHRSVSDVTHRPGNGGADQFSVSIHSRKSVQFSEIDRVLQTISPSARLKEVVFTGPAPAKKAPKPG